MAYRADEPQPRAGDMAAITTSAAEPPLASADEPARDQGGGQNCQVAE